MCPSYILYCYFAFVPAVHYVLLSCSTDARKEHAGWPAATDWLSDNRGVQSAKQVVRDSSGSLTLPRKRVPAERGRQLGKTPCPAACSFASRFCGTGGPTIHSNSSSNGSICSCSAPHHACATRAFWWGPGLNHTHCRQACSAKTLVAVMPNQMCRCAIPMCWYMLPNGRAL